MKKITLFLCCVLLISCLIPIIEAPKQQKPSIFEKEIYFERDSCGIDDYKSLSFNKPKHKTSCHIIIDANTTTDYYIEGWASPPIPLDIELKSYHNFLFSLWGQGNDNASFYFKFYLLRANIENFLFESFKSEYLNETTCEMLWQSKNPSPISIQENDIIIVKLFLHVEIIGIFNFFYDSKDCPSYIQEPTETRYFRDESFGVNGIWLRGLKTSQGTYSATHGNGKSEYQLWCKLGIRVYERLWNSTKFEITNGTPQAVVLRTSQGEGYQQATWDCPEYEFYDNRSNVLVYVYHQFEGYGWFFDNWYFRWHTEQLGASKLNATEWTVVYYWKLYWSSYPIFSRFQFYYNVATRNSRIENFSYIPYEPLNWGLIWAIVAFFMIIMLAFFIIEYNKRKR